jgi:hypothetical protein
MAEPTSKFERAAWATEAAEQRIARAREILASFTASDINCHGFYTEPFARQSGLGRAAREIKAAVHIITDTCWPDENETAVAACVDPRIAKLREQCRGEDAAHAAVPFLKFGRAIGCGHAIEVRSTRSWREMDSNLRFLSQEKPVYVAEGELRGDRTGHQRNLRGTDGSNPSPSSGESANFRFVSSIANPTSMVSLAASALDAGSYRREFFSAAGAGLPAHVNSSASWPAGSGMEQVFADGTYRD